MEGGPPPLPQRLQHFRVRGYRGFRDLLELRDLHDTVVVYGLNNTGKTNLLRALGLFSRLVAQPLTKLLEDTGENAAGLYERLGEDRWMFAHGGGGRVILEAALEPGGLSIGFELTLDGNVVRARLTEWTDGDANHLALASKARQGLQAIQQTDSADSRAAEMFEAVRRRWSAIHDGIRVAPTNHTLPITPELRQRVVAHSRATDIAQRKRVARMRKIFGDVVMGLPTGALEEVEENDFGWVTDDGIVPLDFLGSGAQGVFGMLASIATTDAPILLVDEPESHLNVLQQGGVLEALLEARAEFGIRQMIIASHSVKFARPELDIRLLERTTTSVTARSINPPMLKAFESRTTEQARDEDLSMLAYDNTIELPRFVRDGLGVQSGQYVYFVKHNDGYRIVSEAQMSDALKTER